MPPNVSMPQHKILNASVEQESTRHGCEYFFSRLAQWCSECVLAMQRVSRGRGSGPRDGSNLSMTNGEKSGSNTPSHQSLSGGGNMCPPFDIPTPRCRPPLSQKVESPSNRYKRSAWSIHAQAASRGTPRGAWGLPPSAYLGGWRQTSQSVEGGKEKPKRDTMQRPRSRGNFESTSPCHAQNSSMACDHAIWEGCPSAQKSYGPKRHGKGGWVHTNQPRKPQQPRSQCVEES